MEEAHEANAGAEPILEEIVHNCAIEVRNLPLAPGVNMALLRFHTPSKIFTFKLDNDGAAYVHKALEGHGGPAVEIVPAGVLANLELAGKT